MCVLFLSQCVANNQRACIVGCQCGNVLNRFVVDMILEVLAADISSRLLALCFAWVGRVEHPKNCVSASSRSWKDRIAFMLLKYSQMYTKQPQLHWHVACVYLYIISHIYCVVYKQTKHVRKNSYINIVCNYTKCICNITIYRYILKCLCVLGIAHLDHKRPKSTYRC